MSLLAPIYLLLLVPWAGLVVWLLRRRGRDVAVPFVRLWQQPDASDAVAHRRRLPPPHLLLVLAALLIAILAAARPAVRDPVASGPPITLIIDTGLTMSASSDKGTIASALVKDLQMKLLQVRGPLQKLLVHAVPGDAPRLMDVSDLSGLADTLPATALDTTQLVHSAAREALTTSDQPVIVISAHNLAIEDSRLIQIAPSQAPANVGLAHVAVRADPKLQAMVRIVNQSPQTRAQVEVDGGPALMIDLPPAGQARSYFIDLPDIPEQHVHIRLQAAQALSLDDEAWLIRLQSSPVVEGQRAVPAAVTRMIEVYTQQRPPAPGAAQVIVGTHSTPPAEAGVIIADAFPTRLAAGPIEVRTHPITRSADWQGIIPVGTGLGPLPGEGWEVLLVQADRPLLACRTMPSRQVWIGFDVSTIASQPAFVVLWTNIFDWLGGGETRWGASAPRTLGPGWRRVAPGPLPEGIQPGWLPGIYEHADGAVRAVQAAAQPLPDPPPSHGLDRLAAAPAGAGHYILHGPLLLVSLGLIALAGLLWPRRLPQVARALRQAGGGAA